MAVNDRWRVTVTHDTPTVDIAQWVWHYNQTAGSSDHDDELATAVAANLSTAWDFIKAYIDDSYGMVSLEIAKYDGVNKRFDTVRTSTLNLYGTSVGGDMLPHQDAALVKFFTAVGRSIGKKFVSGIIDSQVTNSTIATIVVTALANFAGVFDNALSGANGGWSPGNFDPALNLFRPYTGTVEANVIITGQDSRRPGVGL